MNTHNRPLYHKIYKDIIRDMHPEKRDLCLKYLKKTDWIALDVIEVNDILFGSEKTNNDSKIDQKHRAYDVESVLKILEYQRKNKLDNTSVANKFKLSRNTISKWRNIFNNQL